MSWPADQTLLPALARRTTQRTPAERKDSSAAAKARTISSHSALRRWSRSRVTVPMLSAMSINSMKAFL